MARNSESADVDLGAMSSMVFDREEGNMNPGVTGLPPAIALNPTDHGPKRRPAEKRSPLQNSSADH